MCILPITAERDSRESQWQWFVQHFAAGDDPGNHPLQLMSMLNVQRGVDLCI